MSVPFGPHNLSPSKVVKHILSCRIVLYDCGSLVVAPMDLCNLVVEVVIFSNMLHDCVQINHILCMYGYVIPSYILT